MDSQKSLVVAGSVISILGSIGFIGLVWLLIYGNLSGNLGFTQDSTNFYNESITLAETGATPSTAGSRTNGVISSAVVTNASGGEIISSGNYTISGVLVSSSATSEYNATSVNVSALVSYDSQGKIDTDHVINNLTLGYRTFFGFSPTFFIIAAIVLLVTMFVGLIALAVGIVRLTMKSGGSKGNFSGY